METDNQKYQRAEIRQLISTQLAVLLYIETTWNLTAPTTIKAIEDITRTIEILGDVLE